MPPNVLKRLAGLAASAGLLTLTVPLLAYHETGQEWVTTSNAYTLRGGELKLGLLHWEAGLLDEVMVGTLPALWLAFPWLGAPVPNAYVKVRDFRHGPLAISVQAGFLWMDGGAAVRALADRDDRGDFYVLSTSFATTWRSPSSYSLGMSLAFNKAGLGGADSAVRVEGTVVSDNLRVSPFAEWRFSRVVALQLNATILAYHREPNARVSFQPREDVTVDVDLSYSDAAPNGAYALWPAIACSFRHVGFLVGAGYGYRALPLVDVMLNERGPVFALDFHVRF